MRSFIKSMLIPCFTLAFAALTLQACSGDTNNAGSCIPGAAQACTCNGMDTGVQTCTPSGTLDRCVCSGAGGNGGEGTSSSSSSGTAGAGGGGNCHALPNTPATCGDGKVDVGEECDDGDCNAANACNNDCRLPYCGDKVIQPPETCDGGEQCPPGCGVPSSSSSSSSGMVDPCAGKLIFAGFASAQDGAFSFGGNIGLDAATSACQALGGFGMCDYEQWKQIESDPVAHAADVTKLQMTIPNGTCTDVWLQRTTMAMDPTCPGGTSVAGPGGNCNNWNYKTGHVADGEHVNLCNMGGGMTYTYSIDCDTVYDPVNPGPHQNNALACNVAKPIPCCYQKCISP